LSWRRSESKQRLRPKSRRNLSSKPRKSRWRARPRPNFNLRKSEPNEKQLPPKELRLSWPSNSNKSDLLSYSRLRSRELRLSSSRGLKRSRPSLDSRRRPRGRRNKLN